MKKEDLRQTIYSLDIIINNYEEFLKLATERDKRFLFDSLTNYKEILQETLRRL